jgi:hypothetical protein
VAACPAAEKVRSPALTVKHQQIILAMILSSLGRLKTFEEFK